jgi:hypothetical protein
MPTGLDHASWEASSPFSRKRTKKLLRVLTRTFPAKSATAPTEAFCFFFSKKKALPCLNLQMREGSKQFFFAKKNQKTFVY